METSVNNKCKAFTSLEQSKKLAEILPLESADMCYMYLGTEDKEYEDIPISAPAMEGDLCVWSLSALLSVLPNGIVMNKDSQNGRYHFSSKYIGTSVTADNPVDACVAMIEKLHELNLL